MSVPVEFTCLRAQLRRLCRRIVPGLVLLAIGLASRPVVGYGATDMPIVPSIYLFLPDRCTVEYTDPGQGKQETYDVQGRFQMLARPGNYDAWFEDVDSTLTNEVGAVIADDLDDIFDLTDLDGAIVDSSTIEFTGTTWDGGTIRVTATFSGDLVYFDGETIPPDPDDDDYPYYEFTAVAVRKYGGGTGEAANPYLLFTPKHLNSIYDYPEDWNKQFKMTANIDLSGYKGTEFHLIGYCKPSGSKPFSGVFNGNGFAISRFTYASTGASGVGLFAYVDGANAQIKNLGLVNPDVKAGTCVGALVGRLGGGLVTGCYVQGGAVAGNDVVGGLIGQNGLCPSMDCGENKPCQAGTVTGCRSTANVTGATAIGGLVGSSDGDVVDCNATAVVVGEYAVGGLLGLNGGTVATSHAAGAVSGIRWIGGLIGDNESSICGSSSSGSVSGQEYIGGLVGQNNGGSITICHSSATVDGTSIIGGLAGFSVGNVLRSYSTGAVTGDIYVGGLVGENAFRIANCYSSAAVSAEVGQVGGLAGINEYSGLVTDCYASGRVTGGVYAGGLLGSNDGIVMRCYTTGAVTGLSDAGGLIGYSTIESCTLFSFWDTATSGKTTSVGGVGKTTADLKKAATFGGWGACTDEPAWTLDEAKDYPRLSWEQRPGTAIQAVQLSDLLTGSGRENDPFIVGTADQFNAIGLFPCEWDKHFKLTADINLSAYSGGKLNTIGVYRFPFTGVFDGNAHVISNVTYESTAAAYAGLFGCVTSLDGRIANLGLSHPKVTAAATEYVGALAGYLKEGTITGCYTEAGEVSGLNGVGGLVGRVERATIDNCHSGGTVKGDTDVGGVLGRSENGTVRACYSTVTVQADTNVGGVIGLNENGAVEDSHSTATIDAGANVGGVLGFNDHGTVEDSYSTVTIDAGTNVGGVLGFNDHGAVEGSYSSVTINAAANVGGVLGLNEQGTVTGSYASGAIDADTNVGGVLGFNEQGTVRICYYSSGTIDANTNVGGVLGLNNHGTVEDTHASVTINAGMNVGGVLGLNEKGTVTGSYASGTVNADTNVGGVLGCNRQGSVTDCNTSDTITGLWFVGGLVGDNSGTITGGFATGPVAAGEVVGGFAGSNSGKIQNAYASGRITADDQVGGFVGSNSGEVLDAHAGGLITGNDKVGGLAGNNQGKLTNCYATGNVNGDKNAGGLAGYSYNGQVTSCYAKGNVHARLSAGGLIGYNATKTTVTSCYATGVISGYDWVGGLIGRNEGAVSKSYASGAVSGTMEIGGLVGLNFPPGTIASSYASGSVSGNEWVGGLAGSNGSSVSKCYSCGFVTGAPATTGGLIGFSSGTIAASFWDTQTSSQLTGTFGTGKTTAQMKTKATFTAAGWDFTSEWRITDGQDYPRLTWQ